MSISISERFDFRSFVHSDWFKTLFRGQIISALIAGTGIFATLLTDNNANFPSLLNLLNYSLLSLFLFRKPYRSACCSSYSHPLSVSSDDELIEVPRRELETESQNGHSRLWYLLAAFLDLEANYLVIKAYDYTSITSVMLLDCFTIPSAMLLSMLFLKCKYTHRHFIGTGVCVLGLILIIASDSKQYATANDDAATVLHTAMLGDLLCLLGSFLYACSNVLEEYLVKFHDRENFLGSLGGFGVMLALMQFLILDLSTLRRNTSSLNWQSGLFIAGFVACLFSVYVNASIFLQKGDATLFNLSLLTSDVYAVVFSYFMYGQLMHWLYFVAFACVAVGLSLYHSAPTALTVLPSSPANGTAAGMSSTVTMRIYDANDVDTMMIMDEDDHCHTNVKARSDDKKQTYEKLANDC